jgi:excisionase family DNA binding protein
LQSGRGTSSDSRQPNLGTAGKNFRRLTHRAAPDPIPRLRDHLLPSAEKDIPSEAERGASRTGQWRSEQVTASASTPAPACACACVTRFELASLLQVSLRTVDRMIAAGEIPVRRVRGKAVRFLRADVDSYLGEKSEPDGPPTQNSKFKIQNSKFLTPYS